MFSFSPSSWQHERCLKMLLIFFCRSFLYLHSMLSWVLLPLASPSSSISLFWIWKPEFPFLGPLVTMTAWACLIPGAPCTPRRGGSALLLWKLWSLKAPATTSLFLGCQGLINQDNTREIGVYREELLRHWCLEVAARRGDSDSSSLLSFLWSG